MMEGFDFFNDIFWSEKFWLPSNVTWDDLTSRSLGKNYAKPTELLWPVPFSFMLLILRHELEKYCFKPIGLKLKIRNRKVAPPSPIAVLEENYRKSKHLTPKKLEELSRKLEMSPQNLNRWWKRRRAQDRPTVLKKFCECCWKGFYYMTSFSYGLWVLWDKPYFWNFKLSVESYPYHALPTSIWYYYMISLSFYWSSTFMHFFEAKRKDFWEMLSHHIVTILLISLSWVCNYHRAGALILVVHDFADIFMEAAKSLKYAKLDKACDIVFAVFTINWLVTRLYIFPQIIYVTLAYLPMYPVRLLFNALLIALLGLHCYWTFLLFQLLLTLLKTKEITGDTRSSSEDDDLLTEDEKSKNEKVQVPLASQNS